VHETDAPSPRRWLLLLALTGSLSMIFVDITVTAVAGPAIGSSLALDERGVAWIATSYLITLAAGMAIGGRVGDIAGKRNAFMVGVLLFAAASALCGAAGDATTLYAGRVLQGVAACLMQPASAALVIEHFAPGERGKAMGIYIGIPMMFFALGPVLGGMLAERAGWRWVFYVNLPIALAAVALALAVRAPNRRAEDRSFDILSALLVASGLPLAVFALQEGAKSDADGRLAIAQPGFIAMLGAGVMLTALFAYRQLTLARPLIHLGLFADRRLRANVLLVFVLQYAMASLIVQGSIYATDVLGYGPEKAGASLMPMLVPVIFLASVAGRLYDRRGVRPLARFGTVVATAGLALWGIGSIQVRYPVIAAGMALLGVGVAFIMSPASTDTLSSVDDASRGQVSGLMQTFRQVGGALGVAGAAAVSGAASAYGLPLSTSIGVAILAGAAVASLGIVVALRMPASPARVRGRAGSA
jgi:EmrB/QacA subfamily drug resistance transporter